jgi:3-methylcrotonyl-CoA carboxylase alpha subunit
MLSSVLIANRGEIACRVARTARRLGMRSIAVYSDADAGAPHVRACDEAYAIGGAPASESYLAIDKIIAVARQAGADCIHPGYGFLSENAEFAEACAHAGIVFVGPPPHAIRDMGLKDRAKLLMERAGVPIVPGYHGELQDPVFLKRKAYEIGYPVLVKAVAGGGGKGMRRVDKHAEFDAAFEAASREARAAFGDTRVLIEKCIEAARHIEFQIFADAHGNVIHLGERDCTLQRRHQKLIEEAPAPGMSGDLRSRIGRVAVAAAKAVGYVGAGTVEFVADGRKALSADRFWFLEMNTRLQVEHPVTEAITGLDLVEWQFRIAAGEPLPRRQDDIRFAGHAVEARVYAEGPGFVPSTGRILALELPDGEGVRVDTGVEAGTRVTPFYDSLLCKVIAHGDPRGVALDRLAAALDATVIAGPRTNTGLLAALVRAPEFRAGKADTDFVERNLDRLQPEAGEIDRAAAALGVAHLLAAQTAEPPDPDSEVGSPWDTCDGFQLVGTRLDTVRVLVDGRLTTAQVRYGERGPLVEVDGVPAAADARVVADAGTVHVLRQGRQTVVRLADAEADAVELAGGGVIVAPMHGKLISVLVAKGDHVRKGERLAVIEAMKMEHALLAPFDGVVAEITVAAGAQIAEKARIMVVEPAGSSRS